MDWNLVLAPLAVAILTASASAVVKAGRWLVADDKSRKMHERLDEMAVALGDAERLKSIGLAEWAAEFEQEALETAVRPLARWRDARVTESLSWLRVWRHLPIARCLALSRCFQCISV